MRVPIVEAGGLAVGYYGAGPLLVALHGFTLTGAQFAPLATYLDRQIAAPDLPGHGDTTLTPVDLATTIDAIAAWLTGLPGPVPVLGYSMGGRIAMSLALDHPELVERLVVISAGPGIRDARERAARARRDDHLAAQIQELGVDRFLEDWLDAPITSTTSLDEPTRLADRAIRQTNSAEGLAAALRGLGQGASPYLGDRLGGLTMPLLTVSGGTDVRYGEYAASVAAGAGDGTHQVVVGVGHNVVLQAPRELARLVAEFLG
ncbi:MAG: 2-succinyl-6-hydroxy-2,4-cyclohexadiene-1-carboxylate synthase [Acidimicrobiia bacterium]|nr:MAG: 2-succinyl-6-hydroxy-2,4-cyclohexadiene-1-carboxylate synthase [Acidimicrobiia bacterium]